MARRYTIKARLRASDSLSTADARQDFVLHEEGETTASLVRSSPHLSLYSLDLERDEVAFVETSSHDALREHAFLYQAQRNQATAIHVLTLDEFHRLALSISFSRENIRLVYSVGRSGSTLMHRFTNRVPGVISLSEPDAFASFLTPSRVFFMLPRNGAHASNAQEVLTDIVKVLWHQFRQDAGVLVIKLRSELCWLWQLLDAALDNPISLFLYRDATQTVQSFDRAMARCFHGRRQWMLRWPLFRRWERDSMRALLRAHANEFDYFRPILQGCTPQEAFLAVGWCGVFLLLWVSKVDAYLQAYRRSPNTVYAVRYEDVLANGGATLANVFRTLGFPESEVEGSLRALETDSQAGTALAHAPIFKPLDGRTIDSIARLVRNHTRLGSPSVVLPGTIKPLS